MRPHRRSVKLLACTGVLLVGVSGCLIHDPPGNATIYTDVYGVPHIYGETEYDVMFGMGYAMARDQLDTIVTLYRAATGTLSAREGAGEEYVNIISDYLVHLFLVPESAETAYASMPEPERLWLDGFAEGINTYIREHNRTHSPHIEYFSGKDVAAWGIYIAYGWQFFDIIEELQREIEIDLKVRPKIALQPQQRASNQWAVRPPKTDGPAMVYADPHLIWEGPSQWYETHLKVTKGTLDVAGVAVIGTPLIAMGRNAHVAWSLTSNTPPLDTVDVYKEKLVRPNRLSEYVYEPAPSRKKRIVKRMLLLNVKDFPLPLCLPRYYTHHGPLLPVGIDELSPRMTPDGYHVYSVAVSVKKGTLNNYPGLDVSGLLRLFYRLDTAKTVHDIKLALGLQGQPDSYPAEDALQLFQWNVMAGDVQGNIFYIYNGRCPVRVDPHFEDPDFYKRPVPGWTGAHEWQRDETGHVVHWAIADLPQVMNPAGGYLVNCNVAPWYVCPDSGIDPEAYPPYLVRDINTERNLRARALLENTPVITEQDMRRFALDVHIDAADVFERHLFSFYDPWVYPGLAEAAVLLASQPNEATEDNTSVLLLHRWFAALGDAKLEFPDDPAELTDEQRLLLIEALREARDELGNCPHGLAPRWGDVHYIDHGRRFPVGGGAGPIATLFQASGPYSPCQGIEATSGSSFLQITVLTPGATSSWSLRPIGSSSDPSSPHYNDETERFAARDPDHSFKFCPFTHQQVATDYLESTTRLGPQ